MTASKLIVFPSKLTLTVSPSADQSTLPTSWLLVGLRGLIVHEIEARMSEATAQEKTFGAELHRAEWLLQSMRKQAFMGKSLKSDVPTSPTA